MQGPPGHQMQGPHGPPGMMPPHMQGNGPRMNGPMGGNMMPPHPHGMIPQDMLPPNHPHRMMSPHNQGNMMNPHHPHHPGHPGHPGHPMGGPMMGPPHMGPQQPPGGGKIYPPNQPMIFNPQNPNAPPIHPCGVCHREVQGDSEEGKLTNLRIFYIQIF